MSVSLGRLVFGQDGSFGGIYSDNLRDYYVALGGSKTVRAGHVEPEGDGWVATLEPWAQRGAELETPRSPCFTYRAEALAWEDRMVTKAILRGHPPGS